MTTEATEPVTFRLDGTDVTVEGGVSLLEALRDQLGVRSVKDGCSPQGQCGCCTVLVDGTARVACVTPVGRVRDRAITTVDGVERSDVWASAFTACGASQCGFCTPGIITRLSTLPEPDLLDRAKIDRSLLAHLCRCTGWQTIHEACAVVVGSTSDTRARRDLHAAAHRAEIEGRVPQRVGPSVALGRGGFADDSAPAGALVAIRAPDGGWTVGASLEDARVAAGKVQGRRTTAPLDHPVAIAEGEWSIRLQTTWVEPAYLEPDSAWCVPGGEPTSALGNGGAFGGKARTDVGEVARRLADEHGRPVRVLWSREDTVRFGPKRPPLAIALDADGLGIVRAARPTIGPVEPPDLPPGIDLEWVEVSGPPVSLDLRGAIWAETLAARAVVIGDPVVVSPDGAIASAELDPDGPLHVRLECGEVLDEVVLRSYCIGAAHMALGMVRSEAVALDADGAPQDLTVRSFGVLRSVDTPDISVEIVPSTGPAINGSDAVFAAVLAAAWRAAGAPDHWPV